MKKKKAGIQFMQRHCVNWKDYLYWMGNGTKISDETAKNTG